MTRFLPYGRQFIDDDDIAAVVDALKDDLLTTGPRVAEFERALCMVTGAPNIVVCNSGTAALHLAALALGLGEGDQVIVPTLTFVATANAPRLTGAEIVFADVDPDTGMMTAETFADALERAPRAKACFPVHMNGEPCDLTGIAALAEARGVTIVEDACHALGAADATGAKIGSCQRSAAATFSFHPVKSIAMGEGGAMATRDGELAERARRFRSHGLNRDASSFPPEALAFAYDDDGSLNPWAYEMSAPGFNYRAPDVLCALAMSQLAKLPRFLARRNAIAMVYEEAFAGLAPAAVPSRHDRAAASAHHLFVLLVDFPTFGMTRKTVMDRLRRLGVGSQVHYIPVHLQPYYRRLNPDLELPGAQRYYERALSLPLYPGMSDENVMHVLNAVAEALGVATSERAAHA